MMLFHPELLINSTVDLPASSFISFTIIFDPSFANKIAMALPNPEPPPVTTETFSFNLIKFSVLLYDCIKTFDLDAAFIISDLFLTAVISLINDKAISGGVLPPILRPIGPNNLFNSSSDMSN